MTPEDAIRFLDHQAKECRGKDASEALCLLLPAMMKIMRLARMDDVEARAFRHGFKRDLAALADGASIKRTGNNVAGQAGPRGGLNPSRPYALERPD
jgi:hypothetical protein